VLRIFQVDAFTQTRFTGNPATVLLDADALSDADMQAVAREFPHAETVFVLAASGPDHDVRLRFFNPRKEAAFVGHATIAAHSVLLALGRRSVGSLRQLSGTGIIHVTARAAQSDGPAQIAFRQTAPELDPPLPLKTTLRVAEAMRLEATHLHEGMPARIARRGGSRLLVPVADPHHLEALAPNLETLLALGKELDTDGFFAFALSRDGSTLSTDARMFCPALGIPEDPVSGNAHAMLAAYLWNLKLFSGAAPAFDGRQGRQLKRPGVVHVGLEVEQGILLAAHIGGSAVIVSEGTIAL
jgi:PhzF family phenazine biosynthesis protein